MRQGLRCHILKSSIALIAVKMIGSIKIIGDIQVGIAVGIVIPPGRRETKFRLTNPGLFPYLGERSSIVSIETVKLARGDFFIALWLLNNPRIFLHDLRLNDGLAIRPFHHTEADIFHLLPRRTSVGQAIAIQIPIDIRVTKRPPHTPPL